MSMQLDLVARATRLYPGGEVVNQEVVRNRVDIELPSGFKDENPYTVNCEWSTEAKSLIFTTWLPDQLLPLKDKEKGLIWASYISTIHRAHKNMHAFLGCGGGKTVLPQRNEAEVLIFYTSLTWKGPPADWLHLNSHQTILEKVVVETNCLRTLLDAFCHGHFDVENQSTAQGIEKFSYTQTEDLARA